MCAVIRMSTQAYVPGLGWAVSLLASLCAQGKKLQKCVEHQMFSLVRLDVECWPSCTPILCL